MLEKAMKISDLNEYIQTLAALGAIIALVGVGYEIRQSNRLALQEATSANWTNWIDFMGYKLESGVSETIAKSMINPEALTLRDKIDLDSFLQQWLYVYHHDFTTLVSSPDHEFANVESILQDLAEEVPSIFGSRYSRAWFQENRPWMISEIADVIEVEIDKHPIGSDLDYYERIDALAATME
jgi:hypothetical protein